jgi:hypothetical protein
MCYTNVVVLYYFKDIYFVNFGKNSGSGRFSREDRYFVKISKEDNYFGNKSLVAYFEVKIVKSLLGKDFMPNILKDINLSSGHLIWQTTTSKRLLSTSTRLSSTSKRLSSTSKRLSSTST